MGARTSAPVGSYTACALLRRVRWIGIQRQDAPGLPDRSRPGTRAAGCGTGHLAAAGRSAAGWRCRDVRAEFPLVRHDDADPSSQSTVGGRHNRQLVVLAHFWSQRFRSGVRRNNRRRPRGSVGPGGGGAGPGGGATFGGAAGPLRLFNSIVGGQIAWLLPLAAVGLVLGLWAYRRSPRTDLRRSAYVLWGGWAVVSWVIFSFSEGIFHPYYTTALAPAVAVLAAGGLVALWERSRSSTAWTAMLATTVVGTAALGAVLLDRATGFVSFLAPIAMAVAVLAGVALLFERVTPAVGLEWLGGKVALFAAIGGLVALLAGPTAYSIATVGKTLNGGNPLAGPPSAELGLGGPGGGAPGRGAAFRPGGPFAGGPTFARQPGALGAGVRVGASIPGGPPPGVGGVGSTSAGGVGLASVGPGGGAGLASASPGGGAGLASASPRGGAGLASVGPGGGAVSKALVKYLEAHQDRATYLAAAVGSSTAGSIALQSDRNVIDMGGFMGSDPAPSLAKLKSFIASGQLHYVLLSDGSQRGGRSDARRPRRRRFKGKQRCHQRTRCVDRLARHRCTRGWGKLNRWRDDALLLL